MANEADKFQVEVEHNGEQYNLSIYGVTGRNGRCYNVSVSTPSVTIDSIMMIYDPVTGNFVIRNNTGRNAALQAELEMAISDAIQNHHL